MKNDYEIRGDVTAIFIKHRDKENIEVYIDTNDLPQLLNYPGKFYGYQRRNNSDGIYAMGNARDNYGKKKVFSLHRLITSAPAGLQVDHIDHNTLNNRRSNLRFVTNAENQQNRAGAQKNNKSSGIRGVCFCTREQRWRAKVKLNGNEIFLGYFNNKEDAAKVAKEARAKLMPYSQEALIRGG